MSPRKGNTDLDLEKLFFSLKKDARNIDLSNKGLTEIPLELYSYPLVQNIYLSDNHIVELPEDFFKHFPCLCWLDLRNNELVELPPSIGGHRKLKNLLLEKNNIEQLPRELGRTSLTGLSLTGNPLIFPPSEVVELGVKAILNFLLGDGMEEDEYSDNESQDEEDNILGYRRPEHPMYSNINYFKESKDIISSDTFQNFYTEDNLQHHGPLPVAVSLHNPASFPSLKEKSRILNKDVPQNMFQDKKEQIKDWEYLRNERKKNKMVLDEWREDARRLQKSLLPRSKTDIPIMPPYGIDRNETLRPITNEERTVHSNVHEEVVNTVLPQSKDNKEKIDSEVQMRMRQYSSQLKFRNQKKNHNESQSRELQRQLLDRKMDKDPQLEYRFKAFTGDTSSAYSSSNKTTSM